MKYDWKDKTILIAEDEEDNFELLKAILEDTNVKILKAVNGMEAIDCFMKQQNLDLILMDLKMPMMDGFVTTRKIRETNKDIPIIAQTAYALSGDKERAIQAGCSSYISKPLDSYKLINMIANYFEKHL